MCSLSAFKIQKSFKKQRRNWARQKNQKRKMVEVILRRWKMVMKIQKNLTIQKPLPQVGSMSDIIS